MLRKTVKELGTHSFLYLIGSMVSAFASIALLPIYTRFLSTTDYGILEIIDNLRGQLIIILLAGLVPAMAKFYKDAGSEAEQRAAMSTSFSFILLSGGIWSVGLLAFNQPLANFLLDKPDGVVYINLGVVLLFVQAIFTTGNTYLNILKQSKIFLMASLLKLGLNIGLNLYFIVALHLGAKGMMLGELLSSGLLGIFLTGYLVVQNGFLFRLDVLGRMLKFGLPFIPNTFGAALMHGADRSILRPRWPSFSAIGIYGLGYRFPFMLNFLLLGSFGRIWNAAVIYEVAEQEQHQRTYAKITTYFMTLYVVCQYMLAVMAPTVIRILAAPEYREAWKTMQIVGLGMCFYALHQFFVTGAFIKGKTWTMPVSYITSATVNIAFNWYFLPKYGYIAAAWTTVITYLTFSVIGFLLFRKIYPIPFEFRRLAVLFGAGIILALMNNALSLPSFFLEGLKQLLFAVTLPLLLAIGPYLDLEEKTSLYEELDKIHPRLALFYLRLQKHVQLGTGE